MDTVLESFPEHTEVIEALDSDEVWDTIFSAGDLKSWYDILTAFMTHLNTACALRKADWEEWRTPDRTSLAYREERAKYARWRADISILQNAAKTRRDQVSEEMRRRVQGDTAPGHGLRLPIYKLAAAIAEYESDETMDVPDLAKVLDDITIWAGGKSQTLREWLEGGASW